jgi:hypothetical protein
MDFRWKNFQGTHHPAAAWAANRKDRSMADKPNPIEIQKALGGVDYPASAEDLVKNAEQSGADKSVLEVLRKLPQGSYDSPAEVSKAVSDSA